jgi:hypothetical protein
MEYGIPKKASSLFCRGSPWVELHPVGRADREFQIEKILDLRVPDRK